jgi:apolipoprotein D and lipocalin family protein
MRPRTLTTILTLLTAATALAQSATPIPKLDPTSLIGTYYVIARLPIHKQKHCLANELVLYALGDKKNSVQIVTTCQEKDDNSDSWSSNGRFAKTGDGRIGIPFYFFFAKKYYIIALAPDATWAIAGTPNHKNLWLLSGTPTLPDATLTQLQAIATTQGYNTAKLITIPQQPPLAALFAGPTAAAPAPLPAK